ncbi:bifunctional aspartate kinase/homoserine dehydrogenase I [Microvenator marinus]|uniref:Bifunctional aspartate kinase/homoserine dehydrogenase I n=1 Tax=Microvenator marinus TaxID=2600177 RepID=A0A5B8XRI9_9DELT|nr:bifunctional aspartate kinase/homoserine dehydrogenase I [Microvenator marinus]QED28164.1 bifunctional aspartate kinase/homoserine dehydrogenase I [Microvenator marinus]
MWHVHKFGGTSVANAARYRGVLKIVTEELAQRSGGKSAVVVSAMAGVTNALIELVELSARQDPSYATALRSLRLKHHECVADLLGADGQALIDTLNQDFDDIEDVLRAIWLLKSAPTHALDLISGYGEIWSAQLLAAALKAAGADVTWLNARDVLVVEPGQLAPIVDWAQTQAAMDAFLSENPSEIVVITGFVATSRDGIATTLGRNGSDYSAAIFGALLQAQEIVIWTDVDGVMSANPRLVPDAIVLESMSYHEAMELAYFGAKVIHPSTMAPAVARSIPLYIKNTFAPEKPGTRIHTASDPRFAVKGIATVDQMALINVEGTSMIGVPGIASRLFGALREADVNVVMISQGSSEHSICFAVPEKDTKAARAAVEQAFFAELHHGQIQTIDVVTPCTVLAVVGDHMAGIPGIAAKFFGALGNAGVNIRAVAQGSSERNISVVIDTANAQRALRAVHSGFYLSNQTISVGIIGPGVVGATLIKQLAAEQARLSRDYQIDLRVRGIADSKKMLLHDTNIELGSWEEGFSAGLESNLDTFAAHVASDGFPHAVIIDCTASEAVARHYLGWLEKGVHVVTPNKKANSVEFDYYQALKTTCRKRQRHYLYETTVGAGLPIIQTLHDLIQTGDKVQRIEGILSGTLAYLFNAFDGSTPFSNIVRDAKTKGYTEPDPRDDLSGTDVARKLVILAREMGLTINLEDVEIESLVPEHLQDVSVAEFLERLSDVDDAMLAKLKTAKENGAVLRFVGQVDQTGKASVKLSEYADTHPFARIQLTDNIVQFTTARYSQNPLVVQGPGAGPEVTAAGAFGDLLRLANYLGAPL